MNYGVTQMTIGNYAAALDYFQRATQFTPNYKALEVNLGIAHGGLNQINEADAHFERAVFLDPSDYSTRYFYGRWLYQTGKAPSALQQLQLAVQFNPNFLTARDLLASVYSSAVNQPAARATAEQTLRLDPSDAGAKAIVFGAPIQNADHWINASLYQYRASNYQACINSARQALKLNPNSELAYNNIGAAYAALKQYDLAIENERQALLIKPDFQLAKNNLSLYTQNRTGAAQPLAANRTAEDWLNTSLRDNLAGQYGKSIRDAEQALRLRPNYAEAYNNIAAANASLKKWDQAIAAAQTAIRLKPDVLLAKNNLAWAELEKAKTISSRSVYLAQ